MANLTGNTTYSEKVNRLLTVQSIMTMEEQRAWMSNHPTGSDPFGTRAPTKNDRLHMGRDHIAKTEMQRLTGPQFDPLNQTVTGNRTNPLTYDDLGRMQRQMDANRVGSHPTRPLSLKELNNQVREWLTQTHHNEEAFLRYLANQLNLSPLEAIVECIKIALTTKDQEPTVLNDINKELNQLEKEKHEQ